MPEPAERWRIDRFLPIVAEECDCVSLDIATQTAGAGIIICFDPDERHLADEPAYFGLEQKFARTYVGARAAPDIPVVANMTVTCLEGRPDNQAKDRTTVIAAAAAYVSPMLRKARPELCRGARLERMRANPDDPWATVGV
jgi:hypothetical protein